MKTLRIVSSITLLAALLACSLDDLDRADDPPPPVVQPPAVQPPAVQPPNVPPPNVMPSNVPPPNVPPPNIAPQANVPPAAPFSLRPGFLPDPHIVRGQSGGPVSAGSFSSSCRGNVPAQPQHTVTLEGAFSRLRILARANGDSTLVVRMPDGSYRCDDDTEGVNPVVDGAFQPGTYQIFVGSYHQGAAMPYVLGLSELSGTSVYDLPL